MGLPARAIEFNRETLDVVETDAFSIFDWLSAHGYHTMLFYESDGRFIFSTTLDNQTFLKQIYEYADAKNAKIYYFDIVVFHGADDKAAADFIQEEESHRRNLK